MMLLLFLMTQHANPAEGEEGEFESNAFYFCLNSFGFDIA